MNDEGLADAIAASPFPRNRFAGPSASHRRKCRRLGGAHRGNRQAVGGRWRSSTLAPFTIGTWITALNQRLFGPVWMGRTVMLSWEPMFIAAGAITGLHVCWSMLLGSVTAWMMFVPLLQHRGIVEGTGYAALVQWTLWGGVGCMVTSSLLSVALQWQTAKREGIRPRVKVGHMMSRDVNYVIQTLDTLVREKNLRPKILVVHPFRADMVPDAQNIDSTPRVQVVMRLTGERAGGRSTPPAASCETLRPAHGAKAILPVLNESRSRKSCR